MSILTLCIIGERGHTGYILDGLKELRHVKVIGLSAGGAPEGVENLAGALHSQGHAPRLFDEYRAMLDQQHPNGLCVIGPFERHAEMCSEAFARGIPVLCEKPVALNLEELSRLRTAWLSNPLPFAALMGMRYEAPFYTAWKTVHAGEIGEVRLIQVQKSYKMGTRPQYYHQRDTYGGTIPWVGSHAVDLIHWLSEARFETVFASHSTFGNSGQGTLEATAQMQFVMSGEILASASLDYLRPEAAPTHGDDRLRVVGAHGVLEVRGGRVYRLDSGGEQEMLLLNPPTLLADFIAQVEGRGAGLSDGAQTLGVTEACLLARQSADQGSLVNFPGRG